MFGPATFHAAMAEVVVGSMLLASLCAIGCAIATFLPGIAALLYNKFVYTGLAFGFWASFVVGRVRLGPGIWQHKSLSALQGATAAMAMLMTTMASSIGGKLVRGESLFDIMPVWLPSDSATVLSPILSAALLVVGIAALVVVIRLGPKAARITLD